ncbi:MAG TPA: hypothetical protein VKE50_12195, partial [Thermoanaerobaculia bacterium]|nr:hypothetical protein [Thermoanaerobaculia bacterium]
MRRGFAVLVCSVCRAGCLFSLLFLAAGPARCQDTAGSEPSPVPAWSAPLLWRPSAGEPGLTGPGGAGDREQSRAARPMSEASVPTPPLPLIGIPPCRIADTRGNGFAGQYGPPALAPGAPRSFVLTGQCGIPSTAQAVSLNVTVTNTQAPGFVKIFPEGGASPVVSTLNYTAGQTVANAAVVPLGTGGGVTVGAAAGTDLILDTDGYYDANGLITQVSAGTGLSGGGSSGNVTLGIAAGGVTSGELASSAVTSPKIAANAVTA